MFLWLKGPALASVYLFSMLLLIVGCGARTHRSSLVDQTPSTFFTEEQFSPIERHEAVFEPLDSDGRRPMEVRGEFGKGVRLATPSEGFTLLMRARTQFQAFGRAGGTSTALGAQIRRMRMLFRGQGLNQLISFYIQLGFSDRGLEDDRPVPLRDAFFTYRPSPVFHLSVGQMKVPFDRQRMMSSSKLQLVERSEVVEQLNIDRDIGVQAYGDFIGANIRYHFGVFSGDGRNRENSDYGLLYAGRLKWTPLGAFEDNVESDLQRERNLRIGVSLAIAFNHKSRRVRASQGRFIPDGEVDFLHGSAELVAKYGGFSFAAQLLSREALAMNSSAENFFSSFDEAASLRGAFGQGGYLLTDTLEVAGRLGWLQPFGVSSGMGDILELTSGLSAYILENDFKIQGSYTLLIHEAEQNDHVLRLQTQFFF